jgi:Helix-turn-helix domain
MMGTEAQDQLNSEQSPTTGKLLSIQERAVSEQLARGVAPPSQWAQILLAIDEGASRSEAALRAGMTSRQVRYWLAKFRKLGLGIFPQQALDYAAEELIPSEPALEATQVESTSSEAEGSQADEALEAEVEEGTVKKKAKKLKDKKKKKKEKKGKDKDKKKGGKKVKSNDDQPSKKSKKDGKKKSKKDKR